MNYLKRNHTFDSHSKKVLVPDFKTSGSLSDVTIIKNIIFFFLFEIILLMVV